MSRSLWELADVFRRYGPAFRKAVSVLTLAQSRVMAAIEACRTAALGGHVDLCDACGFTAISYNSCRNRHCPKCQGANRLSWLADRENELLKVSYFHVVFTVPSEVADLALYNKKRLYEILFHAASQSLLKVAANPKHLGARIGFLAVLHTWGQALLHHPHVHCVVPGGGLSPDGTCWVPARPGFFLSVNVLSSLFCGLFLSELKGAFQEGCLTFPGGLSALASPAAFDDWLSRLRSKAWVVYCKRPFGGPQQVLRYLGRYTHRVALSNDRILAIDDGMVSFRYKDYRQGSKTKVMTLDATEFIRRFLLHVLPDGFHRIRHYGLLANRSRKHSVALCRRLIGETGIPEESPPEEPPLPSLDPLPIVEKGKAPPDRPCPICREFLRRLEVPARRPIPPAALSTPAPTITDPRCRASPADRLTA